MNRSRKIYLSTLFVAIFALAMTSCSKKLSPLPASVFNVTPSPLELIGTKVPVKISGNIPEKWFDKNTTVTITPVLKYNGSEELGTPQTYQGESVAGNGITIYKAAGGNITLKSEFDYVPEMQSSQLYLRFNISSKGKNSSFPDLKVADGVLATASFASIYNATPAIAPDKFQRIIKETHDADIHFLIQQAELRSSELNSGDLEAWKSLVKEANTNSNKDVNVEVLAYASPDGGVKINEPLAEKREKNTTTYINKEFDKRGIDTEVNANYTAQDWDGFQKLVAASDLQDKDLVLRVLSMYKDPETREREIKNISVVYKDLAETILPQLRRSRLVANVEILGKTDKELRNAANNNMGSLNVEELLYSATLVDQLQKEKIYEYATQKFPDDYRGWNNLGACYLQNGRSEKALDNFSKAHELNSKAPEPTMNIGLMNIEGGNIQQAELAFGQASGASSLNEALGLLYIKKGEYNKATSSFGDTKTNNAALAQLLTNNYNSAEQTLNDIDKTKRDATTYYLKAILAARTNNLAGVGANLKEAIERDPSLKKYASQDLEFAKYMSNSDISNILR